MSSTPSRRWRPIATAAAAAIVVAVVGALMTDLSPWYYALEKPPWQPPEWLFGPAWTLIFALCAVAGVRAWERASGRGEREWLLVVFSLNAFLNVFWSLLFFRLQRPDWALLEVGFLWVSILLLIWMIGRRSVGTAMLLVPYLVWVSFAAVLNRAVVQLNPAFA